MDKGRLNKAKQQKRKRKERNKWKMKESQIHERNKCHRKTKALLTYILCKRHKGRQRTEPLEKNENEGKEQMEHKIIKLKGK